jgi:hypothetical protein
VEDKRSTNETTDPDGALVVLKDKVWREKIVRDHPEIAEHRADVLQAVCPHQITLRPIRSSRNASAITRVG